MPPCSKTALSAATIVAALWLSGCASQASTDADHATGASAIITTPPPATQAAPLPDPVALTDLLGRLADPAVPGSEKLVLVEGATEGDVATLDSFTRALQDTHMIPLTFTATDLAWSERHPGGVVATVNAAGPDPKGGGFSFPMEFIPAAGGWQLSRQTADMLLVFGDGPVPAAPEPAPPSPTR